MMEKKPVQKVKKQVFKTMKTNIEKNKVKNKVITTK